MKTVKLVMTVLVFTVIAVLTGCSDYIISNPDALSSSENIQIASSKYDRSAVVFIKLKPSQSYTIYSKSVKLSEFNSYRIDYNNVGADDRKPDCSELSISLPDSKTDKTFGCTGSGIKTQEMNILNNSNKLVDLKVTLSTTTVKETK